jgi:hypothetical protein
MNPDVIDLQPQQNYILRLIFAGGEVRDFDVKPYLDLGIFNELRNESYFRKAYIEFGSVEWPNGQGLSYDTLYIESVPAPMTTTKS